MHEKAKRWLKPAKNVFRAAELLDRLFRLLTWLAPMVHHML